MRYVSCSCYLRNSFPVCGVPSDTSVLSFPSHMTSFSVASNTHLCASRKLCVLSTASSGSSFLICLWSFSLVGRGARAFGACRFISAQWTTSNAISEIHCRQSASLPVFYVKHRTDIDGSWFVLMVKLNPSRSGRIMSTAHTEARYPAMMYHPFVLLLLKILSKSLSMKFFDYFAFVIIQIQHWQFKRRRSQLYDWFSLVWPVLMMKKLLLLKAFLECVPSSFKEPKIVGCSFYCFLSKCDANLANFGTNRWKTLPCSKN